MPKNIVILTMGLDIGGAETHIVELALALKAEGQNVTVFSNGGAYVATLEQHGIRHIRAPMNNKRPKNLLRCIKIVHRYCCENQVDVIHSHTRITNYIAHYVCKRRRLPMVTTVHGKFKLNFLARFFSHWGTRALAVSEDLKEYLVRGYDFDPEKVRITVNGINLDTFSPGSNPALRKKYGLSDEHKVILCVSRVDPDACDNLFHLLDAAKEIYDGCPSARIVMVGDGSRFDRLKSRAAEINAITCENFVQLAGAQTDIASYCRMADVFSGVSRSVLEAIACKLPVLLLGNNGYLGIFDDRTRQACIDTNFTFRGYPYPSAHEIAEIMLHMLQKPQDFAENIEQAYRLVLEHYSVGAMVSDALASYEEAERDIRPNDLMISGYYGTHNFGDDVTLKAIIENIQNRCRLNKIVLLNHTTDNFYKNPNITVVHRFNLLRILPMMKKTKLFMFGGGSLLQDVTSNRSIFFYLFMLRHAQKYGCKTMLYANGIGPVTKRRHRKAIFHLLHKVTCITLRDKASYDFLLQNGFSNKEIHLTADETYNCDYTNVLSQPLKDELPGQPILLINLRTYGKEPPHLVDELGKAINDFCTEKNFYPVLMPVQFAQDLDILCRLSQCLSVAHKLFTRQLSDQKIIQLIDRCDILLTERLHPIIFAARMKKPFAAVAYDPKVSNAAEQLGMSQYAVALSEVDSVTVRSLLFDLEKNQSALAETLQAQSLALQQRALINSQLAARILGEETDQP